MILEEPIKEVPLVKNYIDGEWVESKIELDHKLDNSASVYQPQCKKGNSLLQATRPVFPQFLQVNFSSICSPFPDPCYTPE